MQLKSQSKAKHYQQANCSWTRILETLLGYVPLFAGEDTPVSIKQSAKWNQFDMFHVQLVVNRHRERTGLLLGQLFNNIN